MNKKPILTKKHNRGTRIGLIAVAIIVLAIIFCIGMLIKNNIDEQNRTYPLGDKMEYIGKDSYGCWFGCGSQPTDTYYYATDMDATELADYFHKVVYTVEPSTYNDSISFSIETPVSSDSIAFTLYANKQHQSLLDKKLKANTKNNIVRIPDFDYETAKNALK